MTRALLLSLVSFVFVAALAVAPAFAATVRPMAAHPTATQLRGACEAAGGEFLNATGSVEGVTDYGCHKENCDGNGGTCSVNCDAAGCTATTPIVLGGPQTLLSILQSGDLVLHKLDQTPTGSLFGGDDALPAIQEPAGDDAGGGGGGGCGLQFC